MIFPEFSPQKLFIYDCLMTAYELGFERGGGGGGGLRAIVTQKGKLKVLGVIHYIQC